MSYCINPKCLKRLNHDHIDNCEICGTSLRIQDCYRLVQPLRNLENSRYVEVFEIEDIHNNHKVLKILKASYEELVQLFIAEAKVLSWLDHPGIPRVEPEPEGYFKLSLPKNVDLHCIVMEKIEGETLSQWLVQDKDCSVNLALKWLKDLTQILEQVHQNNLFHRDIKPSNIIRRPSGQLTLIDFGAVKQITEAFYDAKKSSNVLTPGYAPPEQLKREAVPQSDFFALGRTFVHLLTRKHPIDLKETEGRLEWRSHLPTNLPPLLLDLIDDLMHPLVSNRPNSTTEIQQRLDHIFHTLLASPTLEQQPPYLLPQPKGKWYKSTKIKVVFLLVFTLTIGLVPKSQLQKHHEAFITVGETTLFPGEVPPEKQKGMDAIAVGDYASALKYLKDSLNNSQNPIDPEARIFLNNARIGSKQSYTIAVSVPLTCPFNRINNIKLTRTESLDSALSILRGAETAQEEINRQGGINNFPLKLAIVCSNDQDDVGLVAQEIIKHPEILGIVGPPGRKAAQTAEKSYCGNIVNIAPNSASDELKNCDHFIFRMLPNDFKTAKRLSGYMLFAQQRQKAVIFFNSKNLHSRSLQKEFEHSLTLGGGKVLDKFDFSDPKFNAKKSVELALSKNTDVLVLFPDAYVLDKALEAININQQRLLLLSGANMFSLRTLAKTRKNSFGMVVEIPCNDKPEDLSYWRYVLAYESIQSFSTALRLNPSRSGIRSALSSPNFQAKGICEPVRFLPSGDRNAKVQLAKVLPGRQSGTGYDFTALPEF
jgi:eukaryotic-like serine/threonine-protein kinase